jgi:hypothetical protein
MLADFTAVEPFGKIAMHVLPRRVSMHVSFWLAVPPEFIHLAADCGLHCLKVGSIVLATLPSRWFATSDEMLLRPN